MSTFTLLTLAWLISGLLAGLAAAREIDGAVTVGNLFFIGLTAMGGPLSAVMVWTFLRPDMKLFKL